MARILQACFCIILVCLGCTAAAQNRPSIVAASSVLHEVHFGPIVDTIIIENREVYDTANHKYDHLLFRLANKVHITTRESVIRRELLFKQGEPYPFELADESERNIRSRLAVYDAWIETDTLPNGHLSVRVITVDEWTLAVGPSFSREGNRYRYDFSVVERNLLGRNQEISARYVLQDTEDYFADLAYRNERFWGHEYSLGAGYRDDPADGLTWFEFGHPFYNLTQDFAYDFAIDRSDGRRDVYSNNRLIARSYRQADGFQAMLHSRTGSYYRKLQLSARYAYQFEETLNKTIYSEDPDDIERANRSFPSDSLYHLAEFGLVFSNTHFAKMHRIDGFSYTEDFTLGQALSVSYGRAFLAGFSDHAYDNISFRVAQGYRLGRQLLFASYERNFWFRGQNDLRQQSTLVGRLYSQTTPFMTLAVAATYLSDSRTDGSEGVILGGESGLRGYERYFRTGDRMAVVNVEARFFPDVRLHSAVFSPALFADLGQAWKRGEDVNFDHVYGAIGAGLRMALEHSSRDNLIRFDVSWSEVNKWQVSVSSHLYFGAPGAGFFLTSP